MTDVKILVRCRWYCFLCLDEASPPHDIDCDVVMRGVERKTLRLCICDECCDIYGKKQLHRTMFNKILCQIKLREEGLMSFNDEDTSSGEFIEIRVGDIKQKIYMVLDYESHHNNTDTVNWVCTDIKKLLPKDALV